MGMVTSIWWMIYNLGMLMDDVGAEAVDVLVRGPIVMTELWGRVKSAARLQVPGL